MRSCESSHGIHAAPARRRWLAGMLMAGVPASWPALAAQVPPPPDDVCTAAAPPADGTGWRAVPVTLPDLTLQPASGAPVALPRLMSEREAVLLNFVFTSCTTVCPPMAQVFAATQERLGSRAAGLRLVSISIDPEHDTPRRLQAYGARFGAGPQWTFLTGSAPAVQRVQRAFQVWQPDKMGHVPVTFWKPAGSTTWWRLDGLAAPQQLVRVVTESRSR